MYKDQWMVLLKEKGGQRYLPVYVDKACAGMVGKVLKGEKCVEANTELEKVLAMAESASVTITKFENDTFYARLSINYQGRNYEVECLAAKALALGMRAGAQLFADDSILEKAGVTATA